MANLRGYSGNATPLSTSETVGTSVPDPALGSIWTNAVGDKVYVVVDCQQAFVAGEPVIIDSAHAAVRLHDATVTNGRVGVITAAVSGSDTKAYAQIYGLYEGAAGTTNVASSRVLGVPTGTSDMGSFTSFADSDEGGVIIQGAYAVNSPDSGAGNSHSTSFISPGSSATLQVGFNVWLNYPYLINKPQVASTHDT